MLLHPNINTNNNTNKNQNANQKANKININNNNYKDINTTPTIIKKNINYTGIVPPPSQFADEPSHSHNLMAAANDPTQRGLPVTSGRRKKRRQGKKQINKPIPDVTSDYTSEPISDDNKNKRKSVKSTRVTFKNDINNAGISLQHKLSQPQRNDAINIAIKILLEVLCQLSAGVDAFTAVTAGLTSLYSLQDG